MSIMQNNSINNSYFKCFIEDEILFAEFTEEVEWDLEKAKECIELRLKLSNGKSYPILLDARKVNSISMEARSYMSTDMAMKETLAAAVIIESRVSQVMGNFYLIINKPKLPFRLFNEKKAALKWLKKRS